MGSDVLLAARQGQCRAKVVMLTGVRVQRSAEKAFSLGAHDYIRKPFKLGTLDGILEGLTGPPAREIASKIEAIAPSLCSCSR